MECGKRVEVRHLSKISLEDLRCRPSPREDTLVVLNIMSEVTSKPRVSFDLSDLEQSPDKALGYGAPPRKRCLR